VSWASAAADIIDPQGDGLWTPYPKQELATRFAGRADETLFGGAAGPGKTEWLLEYGIRQMEAHRGNRGGIFRRVFPSLNRTVIPRLKVKLHGRARWNGQEKTFTFPNDSVLECASLQYADDVLDHQGAEYGWIGFEELTEFLQSQWEYMINRLRAPADGIRPHACATTNPGGPGHVWVKRRFVKPRDVDYVGDRPEPYEVWRPRLEEGRHDSEHPPGTRVFVPATHDDNPALLRRDPGYIGRIRAISDRGLRLAMEKGDWDAIDAVEGALWRAGELDAGRVSPEWFKQRVLRLAYRRVLAVDPSDGEEDGDAYGVALCARGADGCGYVEQTWGWNLPVGQMARQSVNLYHEYGCSEIVVERNHGGKWMMEVFRQADPGVNTAEVWASDGKRTRAEPVASLFAPDANRGEGRLWLSRMVGFQPEVEEEMTSTRFLPGEESPNQLDAVVWGLSRLMLGAKTVKERKEGRDQRLAGRR
jgi:hypothetical protein